MLPSYKCFIQIPWDLRQNSGQRGAQIVWIYEGGKPSWVDRNCQKEPVEYSAWQR